MGWLAFTLLLIGLPLHAQRVYKVNVGQAGPDSRLEFSVGAWSGKAAPGEVISTTYGEWEVTVEFDAAHCAVYCTYRRMRETSLLAPPVTTLRFYAEGRSAAAVAAVDPSGTRLPRAAGRVRVKFELDLAAGRRACLGGLTVLGAAPAREWAGVRATAGANEPGASLSILPLRI